MTAPAATARQIPPCDSRFPYALEAYAIQVGGRWIGEIAKIGDTRETIAGNEVERTDWSWESETDGGGGVSRTEALTLLCAAERA